MRMRSALAAVALAVAGFTAGTAAQAADVFTVYMSSTGSDSGNGLTPGTAVKTLVRVQEVLRAERPTTDVEVRIKFGTYTAPPMQNWRFYVPGHTITFMPADYEYGEGRGGIEGLPVFRNVSPTPKGFWLQPKLPTDPADPLFQGGDSGLRFYYLQVERYVSGGVSVHGDSNGDWRDENHDPPMRKPASKGLNGNKFFGMVFAHLGSKWGDCTDCMGYGAIVLTNSSNNQITNNHFDHLENVPVDKDFHLHGTYVTHFSSHNNISDNKFTYQNGDPIKVRDRSNHNTFDRNVFIRTGHYGFYRDEICDKACVLDPEHNVDARQCASYGNKFRYNRLISDYIGDNRSAAWTLDPPGLTYTGGAPCTIPAGEQRLHTAGNTTS